MKCKVVSINEWLYPDTPVTASKPKPVVLHAARGTRTGFQMLLKPLSAESQVQIVTECTAEDCPEPELFQLIDVMVERNTGPIGFIAKEGESADGYATRLAPFRVYDAMKPFVPSLTMRREVEAFYVGWCIPEDAEPGVFKWTIRVTIGNESLAIPVELTVHAATVTDPGTFSLTNWFSLEAMATRHGIEPWTEAHWRMIRKYGELMRRGRQTHFWVPIGLIGIREEPEGVFSFDFHKAERLIRTFLKLGFTGIEAGHVAGRTSFDAPNFVLASDSKINAASHEGYNFLAQYLFNWRHFLKRNGWLDITVQHVGDEPTAHSMGDYRIIAGIVRKFMPGTPIIDAVELSELAGAVDIWVPKDDYYEKHREEFEFFRRHGDTIWCYTCCFPGGHYMNRLLDMPLLRTRYLQWGCFKYDIPGFLHWGLNHYRHDQDPFECNCPDHGGGNNLPPGDTHNVYPGEGAPWGSVRLEAQAAGIEDYELFQMVKEFDPDQAQRILESCFRGFKDADENAQHFAAAHRRLLEIASSSVE
jgi:hypothetical protein